MQRHRKRTERGQLFIELGAALPIIVVVLTVGFNSIFAIMAQLTLDGACIDAARAASMAPDLSIARARAEIAVQTHRQAGLNPVVTIAENEYHNNQPGDVTLNPYFVLRANVTYKLPFPGLNFGEKVILPESLQMTRIYAYPILIVGGEQSHSQAAAGAIPRPHVTMVPDGPHGLRAVTVGGETQPDLSGVD